MTTDTRPMIIAVDDDAASLRLLQSMFADEFVLEVFTSAETCLARVEAQRPSVFLLDVGLPGIDGYALCERLKARPDCAHIPVIFISGQVTIDARLRGYEVGAHDFVVKPFDVMEVRQKVMLLLQSLDEKHNLESRLTETDTLVGLILSNLDEYAVLLKYLRDLNSCMAPEELAALTHAMLRGYGLNGAVQLRLPEGDATTDAQGETTPVMVSVMNHVRTLERIFEFRKHGVYNFERITVMVDNMPLEDPERCGRLRDHLAIAVETADARLHGLLAARINASAQGMIAEVVALLQGTLGAMAERHAFAQKAGALLIQELADETRAEFVSLGMNQIQEDSILELIQVKAATLVSLYDTGNQSSASFDHLAHRLAAMQSLLRSGQGGLSSAP